MADFVKFGRATLDTIKVVANNINEVDAATFLLLQQDMIQGTVAETRRNGSSTGAPGGKSSGSGQSGQASSAMERLKAKMGR